MATFPSPVISSARLDLRAYGAGDEGRVRDLLGSGGEPAAGLADGEHGHNVASVRVAEKAGFRREGTLRRAGLEDDGLHDQAVFSLLDDEL